MTDTGRLFKADLEDMLLSVICLKIEAADCLPLTQKGGVVVDRDRFVLRFGLQTSWQSPRDHPSTSRE